MCPLKTNQLLQNIDKLHTTKLGIERIKKNLHLDVEDVVQWCQKEVIKPNSQITKKGKNWYVVIDNNIITINSHSYTIITAHKVKKS